MAASSHHYVVGSNDAGLPHYFVELNEQCLKEFEQYNSLCSVDEYEQLLYLLENKFLSGQVPIPPSDVIVVLLTLATASSHYKDHLIRGNDPYNVGRTDIAHRCMRFLNELLRTVHVFELHKYELFELELLRCQLFTFLDSIDPKQSTSTISKRVRTRTNNQVSDIPFIAEELPQSLGSPETVNYKYISALETKKAVFHNPLITRVLSQSGSFWNSVAWALSSSVDDDPVKHYCGEVWLPIIMFIFELYELRHEYYKLHELGGTDRLGFTQKFIRSPLVSLFKSLSSSNIHIALCDHLFVNCGKGVGSGIARPVYHSELNLSATYLPICKPSTSFKWYKSMKLRRRILGAYYRVLADIPSSQRIKSFSEDQSIKYMSRILLQIDKLSMFESFFLTDEISATMHYLPLLAEHTVVQLWEDCNKTIEPTLVDNLKNLDALIDNFEDLLEGEPKVCVNDLGLLKTTGYIYTCTLVLLKCALFLHGKRLKASRLRSVIQRFIKMESESISATKRDETYPILTPYLKTMFEL
ncbi:Smc5-Smc6 complex subunit NSE5 Ecym_4093 [Eremothecium cymbalariae DBVPG|uniref:Uncharacterized protein n=1 Tax=Eremothecium cymbalariae (strain CBS 270.75 / DBVPG 7215 / KCTC 17166 / NRRL Y-17582) TaxID=931890 RepID=G8JT19_ERECY|nr:hypothetical protein Ecym_4093 [Eremothecium cymbalariae DBVPG\